MQIINYADDKDISIQTDDGSGGVEVYFRADGSSEEIVLYRLDEKIETRQRGDYTTKK